MSSLTPPWVIFSDKGRPVAILPAGRPGEVAKIEGLTMAQAQAIVNAANRVVQADVEAKLQVLTSALRVGSERFQEHVLMRDALDLLEEREWHAEGRGNYSQDFFCSECGVGWGPGNKHRPDCRWLSTVTRLRDLLKSAG